jgi:hypothetical protein
VRSEGAEPSFCRKVFPVGNFYVNYATRGPDREAVAKSLRSAERTAFVGPNVDGTTMFFDAESDMQNDEVIKDLGARTSKVLSAPILAVLNHDDDILAYWLFEAGQLVDEYNSCPGYFDGDDVTPAGGDASRLCAAFGVASRAEQVDEVLRSEDYVFAFERHSDLAELLKHPSDYVCLGYRYIEDGGIEERGTELDLLAIG